MSEKMTSDEAASLREAISEYESWGSLVAQQIAENMRSILEKFGPKQESELRYSERDAMDVVLTEAEIDALEYVVIEGRIACKEDYCILRSLLVRLRPEVETTKEQADV